MYKPVTIRGVTYPGIREASRQLGVNVATVSRSRKKGTLDGVGMRVRQPPKPMWVDGVWYRSHADAALDMGVIPNVFSKKKAYAVKRGKTSFDFNGKVVSWLGEE